MDSIKIRAWLMALTIIRISRGCQAVAPTKRLIADLASLAEVFTKVLELQQWGR